MNFFMPSQYKSILKATSIFGGTQIFQMLIQLVRAKFVALLVGAAGMGLSSIYLSSLTIVITFFGMGICTSVVRDLSKANDEGNEELFALIIKVFEKLLLTLSCFGVLFVICTSFLFSEWTFGNNEHTIDYCFLSLLVFFSLLSQGNNARLVGKRKVKELAFCSLYSSVATLLTSVPFFYFWHLDGVVPGLIVSTIAGYLVSLYYARKVKIPIVLVKWKDVKQYGLSILSLGFTMVVAALIGNVTVYLTNLFITRFGGIEDLGFFNAGMSITQNVVSLVFAAMSADYYPRLVASLKSVSLMNETINEQSEILIYLSAPILLLFSILSPIIIWLLLSSEFLVLNDFIRVLCLGMFLKVISYAPGYVSFAKGDKLIYMLLEGGYGNFANLFFSVLFYYIWGLQGIAYAFLIHYLLYYFVINLLVKFRYNYIVSNHIVRASFVGFSSLAFILILSLFTDNVQFYLVAGIIAFVTSYYNFKKLNEKTDIVKYIKTKI